MTKYNTVELCSALLASVPRILGLQDRDHESKTYGCFERYYWRYKLHDFPNARFQEASLLLALLYKHQFPGNIYYKNTKILQWCLGAIHFWVTHRNKDGSCLELYPHERSFCATGFSSWCCVMALYELYDTDVIDNITKFIDKNNLIYELKKTGNWILRNMHFEVTNQAASAALALILISNITKIEKYEKISQDIVHKLFEQYHKVKFFPEYGGFDLGYTTITNSCLCWYAEIKASDEYILKEVSSICEGLSSKIDKHGCFDASMMSRGTTYLYPYAFMKVGSDVISKLENGIKHNFALTPCWLDDRYCIPLAIDYAKAITSEIV